MRAGKLRSGAAKLRSPRLGAVVAVVAVAAFAIWYFAIRDTGGNGGNSTNPAPAKAAATKPVATSESDLASLAGELGQPIYWAGTQPNTQLELTINQKGWVYVRYLPPDVKIGAANPAFLTVATYPFEDAFHATEAIAGRPGATFKHIPNGGIAVTNKRSPTSVYVAYPGENFQAEVYDPDPKQALSLATSGAVTAIG